MTGVQTCALPIYVSVASNNNIPVENIERDSRFYNENERRAHQFFFWNINYPVIKTQDNTIAVFDFVNDVIEFLDKEGNQLNTVPVTFHKRQDLQFKSGSSYSASDEGWWWGKTILTDEYTGDVYTIFHRNGMVKIRKIDLGTGKLSEGTVLQIGRAHV